MLSKIFLFRDFTPYSICTNVNQKLVIFLFIFSYNISSLYCMYNFCLLADCVAVIIILLQLKSHCTVSPAADCKIFVALLTANSICI